VAGLGSHWVTMSDEQFLTSPFLPARFYLFSHQLNFFEGALGTPGPRGTFPGYPPLSVGLVASTTIKYRIKVALTFVMCNDIIP